MTDPEVSGGAPLTSSGSGGAPLTSSGSRGAPLTSGDSGGAPLTSSDSRGAPLTSRRLPVATGTQMLEALREVLGPLRVRAWVAVAVLAASTAAGLVIPPLLGRVVDLVTGRAGADALTTPIVGLGLAGIVAGVLLAVGNVLVARVGENALAELRERFVDRALGLPLGELERAGTGDLASRASDDVSVIAEGIREVAPELIRAVLTIVLTLVGLAVLDWRFLLAALLAVPVQAWTVRWYAGRALPLYARHRAAVGEQQQQMLDTLGGAATVRSFRLADEHLGRVRARSQRAVELAVRSIGLVTRFYGRLNLAEFVGLAAVLVAGFLMVRADLVTIGTATAAALYFHNIFNPITAALALVDDAQAAAASLARLVGVTRIERSAEPSAPAAPRSSALALDGVRHAYDAGHEVLHGIDLHVATGERVAVVGASGAGKTTVAKLVAGVHEPAAGTVRLGGVALADLDSDTLGRTVALITQEVHVFAGPLSDDLRLAAPDADDHILRTALGRVGALEWVEALPDGLATVVGTGGHELTAAQAQQVALARALLRDPAILVLDEATAEAGSVGARTLEGAAEAVLAGRTALVVAHRLTQAAAADRVVVLDEGRVVETGTHDDLLGAGGHYAALWTAWSTARGSTTPRRPEPPSTDRPSPGPQRAGPEPDPGPSQARQDDRTTTSTTR